MNTAFRIAASALAIGVTTVGCTPSSHRAATLSAKAPQAQKDANKLYARAGTALQKGDQAEALSLKEQAVALAPRDLQYRMVLGDLYLKSGRFLSAEQAFTDVLTLNPGNVRASLSMSLAQAAQGKSPEALATLEPLAATASPGDLGLAYALAGQPQRAVAMLEPVARTPEADGRIRQNLALAYALSGQWQKARITASQDVSPGQLDQRMAQWAALAQPQAPHSQVTAVLGIADVVPDGGQPSHLALASAAPEPVMTAEAAPPPAHYFADEAPAAPVTVATTELPASEPLEAEQILAESTKVQAPVPASVSIAPAADPSLAEAAESLVKATPAVIPATAPAALPTFKPAAQRTSFERPRPAASEGRFVVQIGAFRNAVQVEKAWAEAQKRFSFADREPLSTTVSIAGKGTFHRLSVAGFDDFGDAQQLCKSIKAKGGACFVRTTAGDVPVQWASRPARPRG